MDVPERRWQVLLCPPTVVMQVQSTSVLFCDILSGLSSTEGKGCQLHLPRIIPPVAFSIRQGNSGRPDEVIIHYGIYGRVRKTLASITVSPEGLYAGVIKVCFVQ